MRFLSLCICLFLLAGCRMSVYYASKRIGHGELVSPTVQHKNDLPPLSVKPVPEQDQQDIIPTTQQEITVNPELPVTPSPQQPVIKRSAEKNITNRLATAVKKTKRPVKSSRPGWGKNALVLTGMILLFLLILAIFAFITYVGGTLIYTYGFSVGIASLLFLFWMKGCGIFGFIMLAFWIRLLKQID